MKNPLESKDVFEAGGGGRKGEGGKGGECGAVDVSPLGNSCATPHPQFIFII